MQLDHWTPANVLLLVQLLAHIWVQLSPSISSVIVAWRSATVGKIAIEPPPDGAGENAAPLTPTQPPGGESASVHPPK